MDSPMNIELSSEDLRRMPQTLSAGLLNWLQYERLKDVKVSERSTTQAESQLSLGFASSTPNRRTSASKISPLHENRVSEEVYSEHSHIRLSELFDAGMTKSGMSVRVRLKRDRAKQVGRSYLNNLTISSKGTVIYENEEFDKPSPLATKLNGSPVNGWEYVEIKREGEWVRLEVLRQQVRQTT